jgi:hypothetical protein
MWFGRSMWFIVYNNLWVFFSRVPTTIQYEDNIVQIANLEEIMTKKIIYIFLQNQLQVKLLNNYSQILFGFFSLHRGFVPLDFHVKGFNELVHTQTMMYFFFSLLEFFPNEFFSSKILTSHILNGHLSRSVINNIGWMSINEWIWLSPIFVL